MCVLGPTCPPQAHAYVASLKLKGQKEWHAWCKRGERQVHCPTSLPAPPFLFRHAHTQPLSLAQPLRKPHRMLSLTLRSPPRPCALSPSLPLYLPLSLSLALSLSLSNLSALLSSLSLPRMHPPQAAQHPVGTGQALLEGGVVRVRPLAAVTAPDRSLHRPLQEQRRRHRRSHHSSRNTTNNISVRW